MSTDLITFESHQFGQVRTVRMGGEPWFVAADVCRALEISNNRDALNRLDADEKDVALTDTLGGQQQMSIVNEPGLYSLVLGSRKPEAKAFKRWITHEVIPSIRKTGGYISGQETMSDSELMAKALLVAQRQIDERNKQIAAMEPKALFADAVSASDDCILVRDMAKILRQNGVDLGEKRFYAWLRKNGYLTQDNSPTQRASDLGLFKMHERTINSPDGEIRIRKTTKVTGKGQRYFIKKFLGQSDIRTTGN